MIGGPLRVGEADFSRRGGLNLPHYLVLVLAHREAMLDFLDLRLVY